MRGSAKARAVWLRVHRWLGLALAAWAVVVGLSGSLLAFYLEIDLLIRPATRVDRVAAARHGAVSPQAVLDRLRTTHPERTGPWRIELPLSPLHPVRARYLAPVERAGRLHAPLILTLDPVTLAQTSAGFWGDDPVTWLYDLHYALLLDRIGRSVVGYAGLLLAISLVTGIVLWWPAPARLLAGLRPDWRPGRVRKVYDAHRMAGVYAGGVAVVLAVTGGALALPDLYRGLMQPLGPASTMQPPALPSTTIDGPGVALDFAVDRAIAALGGIGEARWIESAGASGDPSARRAITVRVYRSDEPSRRFPHARAWIDPRDGTVLDVHDPSTHGSVADAVTAWLHPLHNGEAFGLTGRIVVALAGLALVVLAITGPWRWWQKRRARRPRRSASIGARPEHPSEGDIPLPR